MFDLDSFMAMAEEELEACQDIIAAEYFKDLPFLNGQTYKRAEDKEKNYMAGFDDFLNSNFGDDEDEDPEVAVKEEKADDTGGADVSDGFPDMSEWFKENGLDGGESDEEAREEASDEENNGVESVSEPVIPADENEETENEDMEGIGDVFSFMSDFDGSSSQGTESSSGEDFEFYTPPTEDTGKESGNAEKEAESISESPSEENIVGSDFFNSFLNDVPSSAQEKEPVNEQNSPSDNEAFYERLKQTIRETYKEDKDEDGEEEKHIPSPSVSDIQEKESGVTEEGISQDGYGSSDDINSFFQMFANDDNDLPSGGVEKVEEPPAFTIPLSQAEAEEDGDDSNRDGVFNPKMFKKGESISSSELGNATSFLDFMNGVDRAEASLELPNGINDIPEEDESDGDIFKNISVEVTRKGVMRIAGQDIEKTVAGEEDKVYERQRRVRSYTNKAVIPKANFRKPKEQQTKLLPRLMIRFIICCAVGIFAGLKANSYYAFQVKNKEDITASSVNWIIKDNIPFSVSPFNGDLFMKAFFIFFAIIALILVFLWFDEEQRRLSRVGKEHGNARLGTASDYKKYKNKFME